MLPELPLHLISSQDLLLQILDFEIEHILLDEVIFRQDLLHRFAELCSECSTVEKQPKLEGRQMLMFLAPAKDK